MRASADNANESSTAVEVANTQNQPVTAMHFAHDWLMFATQDGAVYAKMTTDPASPAGLVASGFTEVSDISSMD
jgi:hypothetical protein